MASPVDFPGSNFTFTSPAGREDTILDLKAFINGNAIVSAWKLSDEEMEEVKRTGTVFLMTLSGTVVYPTFVGSERQVRLMVADTGKVWAMDGG